MHPKHLVHLGWKGPSLGCVIPRTKLLGWQAHPLTSDLENLLDCIWDAGMVLGCRWDANEAPTRPCRWAAIQKREKPWDVAGMQTILSMTFYWRACPTSKRKNLGLDWDANAASQDNSNTEKPLGWDWDANKKAGMLVTSLILDAAEAQRMPFKMQAGMKLGWYSGKLNCSKSV